LYSFLQIIYNNLIQRLLFFFLHKLHPFFKKVYINNILKATAISSEMLNTTLNPKFGMGMLSRFRAKLHKVELLILVTKLMEMIITVRFL
jgi:hypothetical protein